MTQFFICFLYRLKLAEPEQGLIPYNLMSDTTGTNPEIEIIYEDSHLLVINKPVNLLSQEDHTGDPDVLSLCKTYLSDKSRINRPAFLGLLHRLDRNVGGVMVLAKNHEAASKISRQIRQRLFQKLYLIVAEGDTPPNGVLVNYLSKDSSSNRVTVTDSSEKTGKRAELSYLKKSFDTRRNLSLLQVQLLTGRPHQIRSQFAHAGYPLPGDHKYGVGSNHSQSPSLFSEKIQFTHPQTGKKLQFSAKPPQIKPWTYFESLLFQK